MLSCLSLATPFNIAVSSEPTIFNIKQIHSLPVTATELQQATLCDPILGHVFCNTKSSWPFNFDSSLKPDYNHQHEFIIENNCLIWVICIVFLLSCKNVS